MLQRPFVKYILNQAEKARDHFRGLREAKQDLVGFVLCDRLPGPLQATTELKEYAWRRREIENYLCQPETLYEFARAHEAVDHGPLFAGPEAERRQQAMQDSVEEHIIPAALRDRTHVWWRDTKASDDFLDQVFAAYLRRLELPAGLLAKSDYHRLAVYVPKELIDAEVNDVLDMILESSRQSRPVTD